MKRGKKLWIGLAIALIMLVLGVYIVTLSAAEKDPSAARYTGLATFFTAEDEANQQQAIAAEAARYTGLATFFRAENEIATRRAIEAEAARYTGLATFFSGLRALAAKYPLAYVTASKRPLLELTYANATVLSSPFFNIFATIRLGLFSTAAARHLLANLAAREQVTFASATLDVLLDLAGPHPLFLQIAGFHAFELQQAKGVGLTGEDYSELAARFHASVEEHFGYYWLTLSEAEQRVLATLPAAQDSHPDITHRLEQECLILRRGDGYDYLSTAFRAFVQTQPVSGLLQAGPVAIDENQHQALLHGHPFDLSPTQYTLLVHLIEQAGQVATSEALEQAVWGDEYIEDPERLKSVIKGLRRALGEEATRLENVRGVGYVWRI